MEETPDIAQQYPVQVLDAALHRQPDQGSGERAVDQASGIYGSVQATRRVRDVSLQLDASTTISSLNKRRTDEMSQQMSGPDAMGQQQAGTQVNDLTLLKRAGAGEAGAFHKLLDRHADRLFRLAFSLMGNAADAEDVVQETFAGAFRGSQGFEGRSSVGTWLTRILVTQVARYKRDRKKPAASLEASGANPQVRSGESGVDCRLDLKAALELLSSEHKQVLVLREYEQMSYEEMAEVLGVPRGTVESRLHRARAELREKLKAYL